MTDVLNVHVDTAEPRVARDMMVYRGDGRFWDIVKSTAYVDGITRTGMLMPLPLTPGWTTTTAGLYARLGKKDLIFDTPPFVLPGTPPPYPDGTPADPSKWVEDHTPFQGNVYLVGQGVNDRVQTAVTYLKNRPFYLSWFSFNAGTSREVQMECGWISQDMYIGLRIWTDGKTEIYKNGTFVGEGNVFERKVTTQTVYGRERQTVNLHKASKGDSRMLTSQFVDLMLIPCRRRDLLLISNQGGGFRFTFEDLDPAGPDNTITPQGRFFWRVPQGQPKSLVAPLNFLTAGHLIGDIMAVRVPPETGTSPDTLVYGDAPGYTSVAATASLVEIDTSGPFVPDDAKTRARVQVDLSSDGTGTPFVYGAACVFPQDLDSTDALHSTEISDYIVQNELSVPENAADVVFHLTLKGPETIEGLGAAGLRTISNRPVECKIGDIAFLTGRSGTPAWTDGINDYARRLSLDVRDRCKAMEEYRIVDPIPVDGYDLGAGLKYFAMLPGYPESDMDIPFFGFPLPTGGNPSEGGFALLPEPADKALDWFVKLITLYASHCEWIWKPTATGPVMRVRSLDDLNAAPSLMTLYTNIADAVDPTLGNKPFKDAPYWVIRASKPSRIECEANEVTIKWRDPRTGLPQLARMVNKNSQVPSLAPAARPDNWAGEPRVAGWSDDAITTQFQANWQCATLARRLFPARDLIQFESFFLMNPDDGVPIWKGDKVTLHGIGDVRINTLSGTFDREYDGASGGDNEILAAGNDHIWRPFTYTGEIVG